MALVSRDQNLTPVLRAVNSKYFIPSTSCQGLHAHTSFVRIVCLLPASTHLRCRKASAGATVGFTIWGLDIQIDGYYTYVCALSKARVVDKRGITLLMSVELPPRQKEVLRLIQELTTERGFPPTLADLAKAMGLRNRMTVHQHVVALKNKGMVQWEPGLNRSLRVIGEGEELEPAPPAPTLVAVPSGTKRGARVSEPATSYNTRQSRLPLVGAIAAGTPIDAIQSDEYLEVESHYADSGCYALKVKGESMIEDGIFDGDFVIVKPKPVPNNGEIAVCLTEDGSATLKRFFKEKGRFRLQPANSSMEPIFIDAASDLQIQGVVVALFRKM